MYVVFYGSYLLWLHPNVFMAACNVNNRGKERKERECSVCVNTVYLCCLYNVSLGYIFEVETSVFACAGPIIIE